MAPRGERVPPQEMIRMRSYERVLAFLSREGGIDTFLQCESNTTPRDRIRQMLMRCFGETDTGRAFGRRALASDHAHALRRLTDANKETKAPLAKLITHLTSLRSLGVGAYDEMECACTAVTTAYVCDVYSRFDEVKLRICAFIRALQRLPQSAALPKCFYTINDSAHAVKEDDSEVHRIGNQLDELTNVHTQEVAVKKVSELLDALALDHVWHERMDQLEQDVESGVLVHYDKLRQRGLALINRGDWVRTTPVRKRDGVGKKANGNAKNSGLTPRKKKAPPAKTKRSAEVVSEVAERVRTRYVTNSGRREKNVSEEIDDEKKGHWENDEVESEEVKRRTPRSRSTSKRHTSSARKVEQRGLDGETAERVAKSVTRRKLPMDEEENTTESRRVLKREESEDSIDVEDEDEDVRAVVRLNSTTRGRKRRIISQLNDDDDDDEQNERARGSRRKSMSEGRRRGQRSEERRVMRTPDVTTPMKRRRFSLDRSDSRRMTKEQMQWMERFALEESSQQIQHINAIDSLL